MSEQRSRAHTTRQSISQTCPNRPRSRPEPHGVPRYAHVNAEISRASPRQPVAHASRPRTSPRPPRPTSRTSPRAAWTGALDSAEDGAQTRRTARKRACDARKQHTLSNGHGHGGLTAPINSPMTVSVTPAVAPMRLVSAGTTASTWRAVMGVRESAAAAGGSRCAHFPAQARRCLRPPRQ